MEQLLYDIVKKGYLKDNQVYQSSDAVFTNVFTNAIINLKKHSKRGEYNNDDVWKFLKQIQKKTENIDQISKTSVVLFNEREYEHNKNQFFINLNGNSWGDFSLSTGNLIGQLNIGKHEITIGCRFGDQFLKFMISDADGFLQLDNLGSTKNNDSIKWLIHYIWSIKLKKAFRLGLPKTYQTKTAVSSKVKGKIDPIFYELQKDFGKFKSSYREHSFFSSANLLVLEVFKNIEKRLLADDLFKIKSAFVVASSGKKIPRKELLTIKNFTNPFYNDYNEVISLSKKILQNSSIDFGSNSDVSGFLFDVSMLFEYFIRKLFIRNGFITESKNQTTYSIPNGTNRSRSLYPDIVAKHNDKLCLFDVKYKRFSHKFGVSREDIFQIHTYLGQVGNVEEISSFGFIYPTNNINDPTIIKESVNFMGKNISFMVCLLYVPDDTEYDFFAKFGESISTFINSIKKEI